MVHTCVTSRYSGSPCGPIIKTTICLLLMLPEPVPDCEISASTTDLDELSLLVEV